MLLAPAQGTAVYVPEKEALVWKIKSFPGGREFLLRAKFSLPSVAAEEEPHGRMPPIRVAFEIPYFTVSGIQVGTVAATDDVCQSGHSGASVGTLMTPSCMDPHDVLLVRHVDTHLLL